MKNYSALFEYDVKDKKVDKKLYKLFIRNNTIHMIISSFNKSGKLVRKLFNLERTVR